MFAVLSFHLLPQAILDRTLAIVNGQIITLSDLRTEQTLRKVLNEQPMDDRALLENLIDQRLVHSYIWQYPDAEPTKEEVDRRMSTIKDTEGLSLEVIRDAVEERFRVQRFYEKRFVQFATVSDAEVQKYYDDVIAPSSGVAVIPALDDVLDSVRAQLLREKAKKEAQDWLKTTRRTAHIEILN
jgi:hypothetical protein